MHANPEETANGAKPGSAEAAAPTKKVYVRAQGPQVRTSRARSRKEATPERKRHTGRVSAKSAKRVGGARKGSKAARVLDLLRRPSGASGKELMKATGWQAHSVRGFVSGVLGKKMGLTIISARTAQGERRYSVKS